ncbi:hypothetical protein IAT38_005138 [Cryptococcus sp. DSM 104549]
MLFSVSQRSLHSHPSHPHPHAHAHSGPTTHGYLYSYCPPANSYSDGSYPDDHVCECGNCKCLVFTKNKMCVNCRKGNHA